MKKTAERMVLLWAATGLALGACSYSQPSLHKAPVREAKPAPVNQGPSPAAVPDGRNAAPAPAPAPAPPPPPAEPPPPAPVPDGRNPPPAPAPAPAPPPPPPAEPPAPAPTPGAATEEPPSVIYFDPDVYRVAPQYRPLLEEHARRLKADPSKRLRVEAHADPEGGADYNRALSEKRAETVIKALRGLGVDARQLEARAHGAGRADRSASSDWARYRRVELVYE
jgi:peptidoglycan-associated lipoprotein